VNLTQFLGHGLIVVNPSTSVLEVARLMARQEVDVAVVRDHGQLVGIVTEHDLVVRALASGFPPDQEPISDVMTPNPVTISADSTAEAAIERMAAAGVSRLCVMQGSRLLGLVRANELALAMPAVTRAIGEGSVQN
jgi:CBS domain-containing protein